MSKKQKIKAQDLSKTYRALKNAKPAPSKTGYPSSANAHTGNAGTGMVKTAGVTYGQPQFFSPVHTPINWQIPSKRKEIYQWQIVNGKLLIEDYTYKSLKNIGVKGEITQDIVTDGIMYENPEMSKIHSGNGLLATPSKFGERNCEEKESYEFRSYGYYQKFAITEEHSVFVLDGQTWRHKKKIEANAKDRRNQNIEPNGVVKVIIPNHLIIKKEAKDVSLDDYLLTPIRPFLENVSNSNNNLAYLIGLFVADGSFESNNYGIKITSNKNDIHTINLESVFKKAFNNNELSSFSTKKDGRSENSIRQRAFGKNVAVKFFQYVTGKHTKKKFTKEVFTMSKEEILNLLGGYFDGDGSFDKDGNLVANNYSEDMANQLWWMLVKVGIRSSLNKYPLSDEHYETDSTHYYRLFIPSSDVPKLAKYMKSNKVTKDFIPKKERELKFFYEEDGVKYYCQPIKEIKRFKYSGMGYDLQIDIDHSYVLSGFKVSNCRFYYANEPKVASALDFYSLFPMNSFELECKNRYVKRYFEKLIENLNLSKWLKIISHEAYLLGDCFPFLEIKCDICGGSGITPQGQPCEHEGGEYKRIVVLNPEYVEVFSNPMLPDLTVALLPDDELMALVSKRGPGYNSLSPKVRALVMSGKPIPLDNRNVSHIKFGESGYNKYGVSIIRRLFPVLAYKTKLMTAQWIVAERLILPIKVVKVGNETRPAGPAEIADIQNQLAQTANDPNLTLVTHHAFDLEWYGACYSEDTEVLTENGWKKYKDVSKNHDEKIATYNINNDCMEYQIPLEYHQYDYNGELYNFISRNIDVMVTPNHNMLAQKYNQDIKQNEQWGKIKASEIKTYKYHFQSFVNWNGEIPEKLPYKGSQYLKHLDLDEYLKFIGFYLSEGGLKIYKDVINGVHVSQSENSPCFKEIREIFYKVANSKHVAENVDGRRKFDNYQFTINNSDFGREMAPIYGKNSMEKKIPKWILNLPNDKLKILLKALMDGDGNTRKSPNGYERYKYTSVSKTLVNQIQEIVLRLGFVSSISFIKSKIKECNDIHIVYWSLLSKETNRTITPSRNIKMVAYTGKVWCFTVANGYFITRRNGKIGIHGNSGKVLQVQPEYEHIDQEILDGLMINKALLNGEGPCFHPDVEILTENGWKHYNEVEDNEKLATFNPNNNSMEFQNFKNRIVKHYEGDLVQFKTNKIEMLTTTNHRMWLQERTSKNKKEAYSNWKVVSAEDVKHRSKFRACVDSWKGIVPEQYVDKSTGSFSVEFGNTTVNDLNAFLTFLGYYISEGSANTNQASISQLTHSDSTNKIRTCLDAIGIRYNEIPLKETITPFGNKCFMTLFNILKRQSLWLIENIPGKAKTKRIPKWVKNLPSDNLKFLLDALIDGDGCVHKNSVGSQYPYKCYITSSRKLADDVMEIGLKLGYATWISFNREDEGIYVVNLPSSNIGKFPVLDTFIFGEKSNDRRKCVQRIPYKGTVWCFEVPNEFLMVRMYGKPLICGNTYSNAAIGIEAMIDRLEAWRQDIKHWVEQKIFMPVAKMKGFVEKNEWGETEYIFPRLKWGIMHLRDQQNYRQFMLQLFEKGVISTKRLLETFDINHDEEIEWIRFERMTGQTLQPDQGGGGAPGEMGGGFGGGGGGGGGLGELGGSPGAEGGAPAGGAGAAGVAGMGAPGGAPDGGAPTAQSDVANISQFGGRALKKDKREKVLKQKEQLFKQYEKTQLPQGVMRDQKGRIMFTGPEREVMRELLRLKKDGTIKYGIYPQHEVKHGGQAYTIDFALPQLMLGVEVDGYIFHSSEEQKQSDKERDAKLASHGWTIIRFTDDEIDDKLRLVMETIINYINKKETELKNKNK